MHSKSTRFLSCGAILLLLTIEAVGQSLKCEKDLNAYQDESYRIKEVRVDTPLQWLFGSVEKEITEILTDPNMPLKKDDNFNKETFNNGYEFLRTHFVPLTVSKSERLKVRISKPGLADCDDQAKTLAVVYHVYTFSSSPYLMRAFDTGRKEELKRSVVDANGTNALANYFPQPQIGYDRSRAIFAGSKVSLKQPGTFLDVISLTGTGSSSSAVGIAEASGFQDWAVGKIRHAEYQFRYSYLNLPGDNTKLKQGLGIAQFLASTRPFGSWEMMIRFGGIIEGGNKLSDLDPSGIATDNLASTRVGSVKAFIGANLRFGKSAQAIKASYGLQLGQTGEGVHLDYTKQIFDSAAALRFPVGDHRSFTADFQFTLGSIHTLKQLPVAERFFGGSDEQNFTLSPAWVIRSNPVIRSFAQNRFDRNSSNGIRGGDRFVSTNVTLAFTLWRKPLVPSEIVDDEFNAQAEFGLNFAESVLKGEHLKETPQFKEMAKEVEPLAKAIEGVTAELNRIDSSTLPQAVRDQITLVRGHVADARTTADTIAKDLKESVPKTGDIRKLVVGFPAVPVDSQVTTIVNDLAALIAMNLPTNQLDQKREALEQARKAMADSFQNLLTSPVETAAAAKAKRDMAYPRRVFSQLVNDANIVAVSPVAILDTARLWQRNVTGDKIRFGVGPGIRLTIVSLDVTAAYAFNANRQPWEGRGAFVFTMQASNLFR
ncbi:MAG TPA: hypothetical protein VL866_14900 [Pyrinomonadaceae bacterium]|nr:hypothetical protein [Pyrinomonadaceae bacterium]